MAISVRCPACGRGHKAPDRAAGLTLKCLACGEPMLVPASAIDPAAILLGLDEPGPTPRQQESVEPAPRKPVDDDSSPLPIEEPPPRPAPPPRPKKPKPDL